MDGGPAKESGRLQANDKIIAVNGEPVVGMEIIEAVELIRGPKGTPVKLTELEIEPGKNVRSKRKRRKKKKGKRDEKESDTRPGQGATD